MKIEAPGVPGLSQERTERMRGVYEREKALRARAKVVILHGEMPPKKIDKHVYVESATAARLRQEFEGSVPIR